MREIITLGHIDKDGIKIHKRGEFMENISAMFNKANAKRINIKLTVSKIYNKRSTFQNAYYWSHVVEEFRIGYKEMTGDIISPDGAHRILKQECNYKEIVNPKTGEVIKEPQSTASLSTVEYMEYIERCAAFIAEWFSRTIMEPNQQAELMFNDKN